MTIREIKNKMFLILSFFIVGCPFHHERPDCIYLKSSGEFRCTGHGPSGTKYYNLIQLSNSYCQKAGLPCKADSTIKPAVTSIKASSEVKLCFDSIWSSDSLLTYKEEQAAIQECLNLLK